MTDDTDPEATDSTFVYRPEDADADSDDYIEFDSTTSITVDRHDETMTEVFEERIDPESLQFEFTIDVETDTVSCPACASAVALPSGPLQRVFGDEPVSCPECGYPLR